MRIDITDSHNIWNAIARLRQQCHDDDNKEEAACTVTFGNAFQDIPFLTNHMLDQLMVALQTTSLPLTVHFYLSAIHDSACLDTLGRFCDILGRLPHLEHLCWCLDGKKDRKRSIRLLTRVVSEAKKLKSLCCFRGELTGAIQDFEGFAIALQNIASLDHFTLMSDLAPEIQMPQVLEPLLYATRCVSIKLSGPCLPKVATALKSSSLCRLAVVELSDSGQWQALAKIVSGHSTLECLTIQLDDESMTSSVHTINAINALKENTALKSLNLDNGSVFANIVEPSKAMLRAILSLVTENPTIEDIQFSSDQFAFGRNSFLEKKTFLLKWNGVGRNLWQNSAKSELPWIDALSNASHDVRALFHLLSKNPALCGSTPQLKSMLGRKRSREPTFGDHGPNVRPCIRSVGDLSWSPFHEVIDFRFFHLS